MKKICYASIMLLIALTLLSTTVLISGERVNNKDKKQLYKPSDITTRGDYVIFDVNNISTAIRNNGSFNRDPGTGNSAFEWPKGTGNTAIYASGIWLGGLVDDTPRVAVAEFAYEFDAGPIAAGVNPEDPRWKVYKIKIGDDALNNLDYANWPIEDGAPWKYDADGIKVPKLIGDMTIFAVFNDNNVLRHTNMNTLPLGIEVQLTAFAFNRSDALGNTIYYKWKLINKGGRDIKDAYVSIWADPDLGDSGDDYDGCDTTLGLGFTYNADPDDGVYGSSPPAVGFDFLQGPVVPGLPTDTAKYPDGRIAPGYKFLKMTSYLKYSNDATKLGNPNNGQEVYNYMLGLDRNGDAILDDTTHLPSKFMYPGDPNFDLSLTNWIESEAGGDRRFMMSAGPFNMAPGDSQEIVAGNLIAQGNSAKNSVTALKNADKLVQTAYDINFTLAPPPPAPDVVGVGLENKVVLSWGENDALATDIEHFTAFDTLAASGGASDTYYDFEGYAVYQVANTSGEDPRLIAIYDIVNNVKEVSDLVYDSRYGMIVKVVKPGSDKEVRRTIQILSDKYTGDKLLNDKDYYFVVTAYSYNLESVPKTLESSFKVITVRPTKIPGVRLSAAYGDTTTNIIHKTGRASAIIVPKVIDPSSLTGHTYQISVDTTGGSKIGWMLRDLSLNASLSRDSILLKYTNLGPNYDGNVYQWPEKDGIQWAVYDFQPVPDPVRSVFSLDKDNTWMEAYRWEIPGGPQVIDPTGNDLGVITIGTDLPNYLGHVETTFDPANSVPIEIKFGTGETQKAYRMRRTGGVGTAYVIQETNPFVDVPFTVWDITDPLNKRQLTVAWRDQTNDALFNPSEGNDELEIAFIYYRTYNPDGNQWLYQNASGHVAADWSDVATASTESDIMYGMSFGLKTGHTLGEVASQITVIPLIPLGANDVYEITTSKPVENAELQKDDIKNIMAVPNPYFGANAYEQNQFGRIIRFTNLPKTATIRIFNLASDMVRVIDKDDNLTTTDWDLRNKNNLPVASGMYIVHIEMPGIGEKILKVAIIMAEERLDNF
ncbi:MAG: hypothetical protein HZB59_00130 [Ignavibacteriales bacterium]|nr:hypothetical protein [Ignavibacteriales bacterium]